MDWNLLLEGDLLREIGTRIKTMRKSSGMSQQELADQVGLSRVSISEIERGGNTSLSSFVRILKTFGLINELNSLLEVSDISPKKQFQKEQKGTK